MASWSYDRPHEFKLMGAYTVPKIEVALNAYYRAISGDTYTPVANVSGSSSVLELDRIAERQPRAEGQPADRDMRHLVDFRVEKEFKVDVHRFGVFFDIANLFNSDVITGVQTRVPDRVDHVLGSGRRACRRASGSSTSRRPAWSPRSR